MSDTPRTNAFINSVKRKDFQLIDFARQLERELAEAKAERKAVLERLGAGGTDQPLIEVIELLLNGCALVKHKVEADRDEAKDHLKRVRAWGGRCQDEMEHQCLLKITAEQDRDALAAQVQALREFIAGTPCQNCGGQGFTVKPRYPDGEPEMEQCQWCDEKVSLLALTPVTALKGWVRREVLEQCVKCLEFVESECRQWVTYDKAVTDMHKNATATLAAARKELER